MIIKIHYCLPGMIIMKLNSINIESGTTIGYFLTNILGFDMETEVGVYGKLVDMSYIIKENDRIEIYEKILADPKIRRKKRACNEKC